MEILYSFVIIVCSLMIYFGTKEIYELSSHKGVKYFRDAFLFFAFAYFFRSFIKLIIFYFNVPGIFLISPRILNPLFGQVTIFLFMYFSSMAIFYLLYSVMHKKLGKEFIIYLFHFLSILVAFLSILSRNQIFYLYLNIFLFLFILSSVYISYHHSSKKTRGLNLYAIYVLLLFFWILNIVDILIPRFLKSYQVLVYLASSGVFMTILYKVLKKVGN